jgi:lysophospholipase L1-like esterase
VSPPRGSLAMRLVLAGLATLFTLAALELGARLFIAKLADREQFRKYASLDEYRERIGADEWWFGLLAPHRYLGYALAPNLVDGKNRHNSLGMRGEEVAVPKPPGTFRIACLGASTTYSIFVDDWHESYPALLQQDLRARGFGNVEVLNAGVPAWSSYETLINYLLRIRDLEPDLLIVHQGFGDISTRMVWPPELYRGDNSGYYSARFQSREPSWWEASALLRVLMVESGSAMPASAFGQSVYNEADTAYYLEFARQRIRNVYPEGIFTRVTPAQMFAANPPVYFARNTRELVAAARDAGTPVLLMSFAYTPLKPGFFAIEGFREATDEHNRILRETAEAYGTTFFDFDAAFPDEVEWWAPDGIHVNEKGTALKAKLVADFLVEHGLVPR